MAMSENQVLELLWRTAKPANCLKYCYLFFRETGVNQRQSVVVLDQVGVCHPHRDDMHAIDYTLHTHGRNSRNKSLPTTQAWLACVVPAVPFKSRKVDAAYGGRGGQGLISGY